MTEVEWLAFDDPFSMLEVLPENTSARKLRLFMVACCRRIGHYLSKEEFRRAVDVAERFADGHADELVRSEADERASEVVIKPHGPEFAAACVARWSVAPNVVIMDTMEAADASTRCLTSIGLDENVTPAFAEVSLVFAILCADIFGNPFRPVTLDRTWRTATVTALAEGIYTDHRFVDLPILADALEDAGCTDRNILDHCRNGGEHVRGCWVVDLVLGKE